MAIINVVFTLSGTRFWGNNEINLWWDGRGANTWSVILSYFPVCSLLFYFAAATVVKPESQKEVTVRGRRIMISRGGRIPTLSQRMAPGGV